MHGHSRGARQTGRRQTTLRRQTRKNSRHGHVCEDSVLVFQTAVNLREGRLFRKSTRAPDGGAQEGLGERRHGCVFRAWRYYTFVSSIPTSFTQNSKKIALGFGFWSWSPARTSPACGWDASVTLPAHGAWRSALKLPSSLNTPWGSPSSPSERTSPKLSMTWRRRR